MTSTYARVHALIHIHVCNPPHVQFIKEKNMNVFKVWTKQMLWTKGGQLSTRLDTEGTLNTFFFKQDNKKGAWGLTSFPSKGSGYKNAFERFSFFNKRVAGKTEQLQGCPARKMTI